MLNAIVIGRKMHKKRNSFLLLADGSDGAVNSIVYVTIIVTCVTKALVVSPPQLNPCKSDKWKIPIA